MALEFWWPSLWGTNNNMILTSNIITRAHGSRECMPQFIRNKYQDNNTTHINIMISPMRILYHNSCPWLSSIHTQVYEKPISTQWYLSHAPYTITRAHGSRECLPKFIKKTINIIVPSIDIIYHHSCQLALEHAYFLVRHMTADLYYTLNHLLKNALC